MTVNVKAHFKKISKPGKKKKSKVPVKAHTKQMAVPWGDIPARPFLMVQPSDWADIKEVLQNHLLS